MQRKSRISRAFPLFFFQCSGDIKGMKITVLGSGTSTGVPVPACECGICTSENPRNFRNRSSILVSTDRGANILVDTSPDLRIQALTFKIKRLDAVLLTHSHADHIFGLDDIRSFNFPAGLPVPVYATAPTLDVITHRFHYIFEPDENYEGGALPQLELLEIHDGIEFTAADIRILPLTVFHGQMPVTGFRFGNFAYATDCNRIPPASMDMLRGLDVLMLDGLRYEPRHQTHFTIPEAAAVARELGAKITYLTHLTHTVDHDIVNAELPDGIFLAYDGLEIAV